MNARGEAYISIHFFVSYLEMANKVDITNNMFRLYPYFFVSEDVCLDFDRQEDGSFATLDGFLLNPTDKITKLLLPSIFYFIT